MEQIIILVGNVMHELKAASLCQEYSKDTVGPSLEQDSLNGTVMKRERNPQLNRREAFCQFAQRGGAEPPLQPSP